MKSKPNISLFFPVYKDEKTVRKVTEKSITVLRKIANKFEILIIDDGSPDNAGKIADNLAKKYEYVKVIHHKKNKGYGAAIQTGFRNVKYEWICLTDGDDEYDVFDLIKLIKLKDFYNLIITFRYVKLYSGWRQFISWVYNKLLRLLFKTRFRDISTGLRLIKKSALKEIDLQSTSAFIGAELTIKLMLKGHPIGEVGIQTFPRRFGKGSSTTINNIMTTIRDIFKIRKMIFNKSYDLPEDMDSDNNRIRKKKN